MDTITTIRINDFCFISVADIGKGQMEIAFVDYGGHVNELLRGDALQIRMIENVVAESVRMVGYQDTMDLIVDLEIDGLSPMEMIPFLVGAMDEAFRVATDMTNEVDRDSSTGDDSDFF